ncbi:MAG: UbiA family prenyltransferase, partial [Oscillospiraceae bacterium]|nr:UbiA family prenyltransferase [Oscillospiraceae bacterium]
MKYYIREARPQNWLKNIFIFVPLVFSLKFFYVEKLLTTIFAVAAFCLVSSAIYVFNDIFDRKADAAHPIKCSRPIASGALPVGKAAVFGAILAVIGVAAG